MSSHGSDEALFFSAIRLLTFILVGGGPTGIELASAVTESVRRTLAQDFRVNNPRQARIILIEAGPRILPVVPPASSADTIRTLQRMGVSVMTATPVTGCDANGADLGTDGRIEAGTIIWAAGVHASPAAI